jgi:two-component system, cell cycle response regulator DivK
MAPTPHGYVRVLVVEDYPVARRFFASELSAAGFLVDEAGDVDEALEVAHQRAPDVVLLDLELHGVSGLELARIVRADESLKMAIIIALSGHSQPEYIRWAREAGCDFYLVKPCQTEKLVATIDELLGTSRAAAAS